MTAPVRSFTVDSLLVRVFANAGDLSLAAAEDVRDFLSARITRHGSARIILATGSSQLKFLDDLVRLGGVEWSRVTCFHMDEYLGISAGHPASFVRYLHERVERRVRPGAFHYLHGDAPEPEKECERYAALLREQPVDLCCLGIGENGHLAFNDPPVADFVDPRMVKQVPLDETNRRQQLGYGHFKEFDEVPRFGLTLTIPALVSARRVLCLAPGKQKALIVRQMLQGTVGPACPATCLRTQKQATLLIDTEAAAAL